MKPLHILNNPKNSDLDPERFEDSLSQVLSFNSFRSQHPLANELSKIGIDILKEMLQDTTPCEQYLNEFYQLRKTFENIKITKQDINVDIMDLLEGVIHMLGSYAQAITKQTHIEPFRYTPILHLTLKPGNIFLGSKPVITHVEYLSHEDDYIYCKDQVTYKTMGIPFDEIYQIQPTLLLFHPNPKFNLSINLK